jgi:limonene 1,2-monooxygenase
MIGLDMTQTRGLLEDATDIITRLLRSDQPVTFENDRWTLKDARLHLRPYSRPHMEIAIAAVVSPSGPRLAGRYGHSLLSIGATQQGGFDALGMHWDVMEERSAHYGTKVDKAGWRLQAPIHIAETREQAYKDVAHGIEAFFDYTSNVAAFAGGKASPMASFQQGSGSNISKLIDLVNESGFGVIGTPDDAADIIQRLWVQSKGFGCFLQMAHDWAAPAPQLRSYELFAREVIPRFQGHAAASYLSRDRARAVRQAMLANTDIGIEQAKARYEAEKTAGQKDTAPVQN